MKWSQRCGTRLRAHACTLALLLGTACTQRDAEPQETGTGTPDHDTATAAGATAPRDSAPAGPWQDADARGVSVRAIGQEPGWHLEIEPLRATITFVHDYGDSTAVAPMQPPREEGGSTVYTSTTADGRSLSVSLATLQCADVMSGESFPLTVRVVLADREFLGCGRRLR